MSRYRPVEKKVSKENNFIYYLMRPGKFVFFISNCILIPDTLAYEVSIIIIKLGVLFSYRIEFLKFHC